METVIQSLQLKYFTSFKWILNQVRYTSLSVFSELGQFRKTECGRPNQIPYKSLAGILLRKYFKFFNSTFDLVSK